MSKSKIGISFMMCFVQWFRRSGNLNMVHLDTGYENGKNVNFSGKSKISDIKKSGSFRNCNSVDKEWTIPPIFRTKTNWAIRTLRLLIYILVVIRCVRNMHMIRIIYFARCNSCVCVRLSTVVIEYAYKPTKKRKHFWLCYIKMCVPNQITVETFIDFISFA